VDLGLYGEFRPNVPIGVVMATHGRPEAERTQHGTTYYRYSKAPVPIEIVHLRATSVLGSWEGWSVCAYPNRRLEQVFHRELVALLRERPTVHRVTVVAPGKERNHTITAKLGSGLVRELWWSIVPAVQVNSRDIQSRRTQPDSGLS